MEASISLFSFEHFLFNSECDFKPFQSVHVFFSEFVAKRFCSYEVGFSFSFLWNVDCVCLITHLLYPCSEMWDNAMTVTLVGN